MPIRINCPNCGKPFSAWDDLVGKLVQCPKCQHKTVLPGSNDALGTPPPSAGSRQTAGSAAPRSAPPSAPPPASARPAATSRPPAPPPAPPAAASPSPPASGPAKPVVGKPGPSGTQPRPKNVVPAAPAAPAGAGDFDEDDSLPNGCPNCNATLLPNDDLCDACGYHLVLKKVIDISEMPKRSKSTGFERVFEDQLHDAESASQAWLWLKVFACAALLVLIWLCLGRWWWVGVLVAAAVGFVWWRSRQSRDSEGSIANDPISQVIWSATLVFQRTFGWPRWTWPPSKLRVLTLHDPQFDDRELAELDHLAEFGAIDLEGTEITDRGLDSLRPLKGLRFLVLRKTQVTATGVRKLQQDLPKLVIWS